MFKVNEFRFLTTQDKSNTKRTARSRAYEYERVLDKVKEYWPITIHNVACWLWQIHIQFANELWWVNSDDESRKEWDDRPNNYKVYNILDKSSLKYDCVVCVSTLEHIQGDKMMLAFENLLDQVNDWWHLLLTFDYPNVPLELFENRLWLECKKDWELLNWLNSICHQECRKDLNIVILDITK